MAVGAERTASGTELEATRRAVAELQEQLEGQSRELRLQAEDRERMLHLVSHELRTPITVINGYSRLLLTEQVGTLNTDQTHFVSETCKSARRLDGFVRDLLECSSGLGLELAIEPVWQSLDETIYEVVSFLRPLIDERGLQVEVDLDPTLREAHFDAGRIEQVLTNLLTNAMRYSKPETTVRVETRALSLAGERVAEVSVIDNGPGVAHAHRDRIFEPYVSCPGEAGEVAKLRQGGLGLGLAICRRIIEGHAGTIRVEDEEHGGSRFVFTLPAQQTSTSGGSC